MTSRTFFRQNSQTLIILRQLPMRQTEPRFAFANFFFSTALLRVRGWRAHGSPSLAATDYARSLICRSKFHVCRPALSASSQHLVGDLAHGKENRSICPTRIQGPFRAFINNYLFPGPVVCRAVGFPPPQSKTAATLADNPSASLNIPNLALVAAFPNNFLEAGPLLGSAGSRRLFKFALLQIRHFA